MKNDRTARFRILALIACAVMALTSCSALAAGGSLAGGDGSLGGGKSRKHIARGFSWVLKPDAAKDAQGSLESLETEAGRSAYVAGVLSDLYTNKLLEADKIDLNTCLMGWEVKDGRLAVEMVIRYDGQPFIMLTAHNDKGTCEILMGYTMDVSDIEAETRRFYRRNPEEAYLDYLLDGYPNRGEAAKDDVEDMIVAADEKLAVAMLLMPDPAAIRTVAVNGVYVNETPYGQKGIELTGIEVDGKKVTCAFSNLTGQDANGVTWNYACYDENGSRTRNGAFTLPDLPSGQSGIGSMYLDESAVAVLFIETGSGAEQLMPFAAAAEETEEGAEAAGAETASEASSEPEEAAAEEASAETAEAAETAEEPAEAAAEETAEAEESAEETAETEGEEAGEETAQETEAEETQEPEAEEPSAEAENSEEPAEEADAEAENAEENEIAADEVPEEAVDNTLEIGGVVVNGLPYVLKGVTLTGIEIEGQKVMCAFSNEGEEDLTGVRWHYVCYDEGGHKLREGDFAVPDLPAGQTAVGNMYITKGTAYLFFLGDADAADTLEGVAGEAPEENAAAEETEPEAPEEAPAEDENQLRDTTKRSPKQL